MFPAPPRDAGDFCELVTHPVTLSRTRQPVETWIFDPVNSTWRTGAPWRIVSNETMVRTALLIIVSMLSGCGASSEPAKTSEPAPVASPPSGKRAPCTLGADQTCNEDPRVSSIWGRCTEHGTCECKAGFELGPSGYCRPLQK